VFGARHLVLTAALLPPLVAAAAGIALGAGAYAFGQKPGPTGWSGGSAYNYATAEAAQDSAMSRCRSRKEAGEYCKIIANINGRCFAIAVQESGNGYGWNMAATVPEAERLAMERCEKYGKSCTQRDSFCDTKGTSSAVPPPVAAPAKPPASTSPSAGGGGSPACQKFPDLC
jgi:uncharacterized protein DUF4189